MKVWPLILVLILTATVGQYCVQTIQHDRLQPVERSAKLANWKVNNEK